MPPAYGANPQDRPWLEGIGDLLVAESASEIAPLVHRVKWKRETLFTISLWYTGSGNNWRRLANINPDIDPGRIHIGNTILIPQDLLKRRQPMPASFLRPTPGKKRSTPLQHPKPPPKIEAPPLYGPIDNGTQSVADENNALPVPLETLE